MYLTFRVFLITLMFLLGCEKNRRREVLIAQELNRLRNLGDVLICKRCLQGKRNLVEDGKLDTSAFEPECLRMIEECSLNLEDYCFVSDLGEPYVYTRESELTVVAISKELLVDYRGDSLVLVLQSDTFAKRFYCEKTVHQSLLKRLRNGERISANNVQEMTRNSENPR